ncbi:MAG: TonB family protein [Acidiferrobacterales bacterium]
MAAAASSYHSPYLPWTTSADEQHRLRKIASRVFVVCLFFALIMPFLPVPEIDREKAERLPPRLARLVLERKKVKPPEPVRPIQQVTKKPKTKAAKKTPKAKKKAAKRDVRTARERAQRAGLLAFSDELAALREQPVLEGLKKDKPLQRGPGQAAKADRSVILANASKASAGIKASSVSRNIGGEALSGRASTKVDSPVSKVEQQARVSRATSRRRPSRTIEDIQLVFDRNKAAIYSIYNRALRKDPTLEGKVVLKITIQPSGKVTACEIVSSDLGNPALERKIVARVMLFDFGIKNVETMVVTYPIDFLPS